MPLIYYLPGVHAVGDAEIAAAGLEGVLPSRSTRGCSKGPDGGPGVIVAAQPAGYYPDRQRWKQAPPAVGAWWVGVEGEVAPAELMREEALPGARLELSDGHEWMVPCARFRGGTSHLPGIFRVAADGRPYVDPLSKWDQLCEDALRIDEVISALDPESSVDAGEVTFVELWEIAVRALATNYRVGPVELDLLSVLSNDDVVRVGLALIDETAILAEQGARKKKSTRAATSFTSPGGRG